MSNGEIDLNPTDRAILEHLRDGRCTPHYLSEKTGYTRGNVTSRLARLVEHGIVEKLHKGLYELVDDPEGKKEAFLISLTDEQLDAIASNDVAMIDTDRLRYLVVHADHEHEALETVREGDAEVIVREVTNRE